MITITLKNGESKTINLKSFDREKTFRDAWWAMRDDPTYDGKRFKVTSREGELLDVRVADIVSVDHSDAEYYKVEADQVYSKSNPAPKREKTRTADPGDMDEVADIFLKELSKRGVSPNYHDPFFHRFANMYANHAKAKGARR